MIVAGVALVTALGGTATAASLVTSSQIRDNTVVSADVKNRSLKLRDLAPGVQRSIKAGSVAGPAGETGPAGPAGPAGPQGAEGASGLAAVEIVSATTPATHDDKNISVDCPAGKTLIAPGASTYVSEATLTSVRPLSDGSGAQAVARDVEDSGFPWSLTVYAVCAKVG